ncbi:MAG: hypothetical protein H6619_01720 [Deltaproteobacteria bacterium]|nr:hypothetical protein [Deltaproteobacteria bacterium]
MGTEFEEQPIQKPAQADPERELAPEEDPLLSVGGYERRFVPQMLTFRSDQMALDYCVLPAISQQRLLIDIVSWKIDQETGSGVMTFKYEDGRPPLTIPCYYLGCGRYEGLEPEEEPVFTWANTQDNFGDLPGENQAFVERIRAQGQASALELFTHNALKICPLKRSEVFASTLIAIIASQCTDVAIGYVCPESKGLVYAFVILDDGTLPTLKDSFESDQERVRWLRENLNGLLNETEGVIDNQIIAFLSLAESIGLAAEQCDEYVYASGIQDRSVGITIKIHGKRLGEILP